MRHCLFLILVAIGAAGCGVQPTSKYAAAPAAEASLAMPSETKSMSEGAGRELRTESEPSAQPDSVQRKIIYTAQLSLVVEDFSETESQVSALVVQYGGYVAESNVDRTRGDRRTGRWVVRVPVDRFDQFLDAAAELGVPETRHTNAQDVTEEYVDLEARIKNKQEIERRILKLLEDRSGDIKDVIAVESELGRVREEIERMEGRMRYLQNRVALTTVTISAREQQNYVPPQAPTFATQIGQQWSGSLRQLKDFGQSLVLFVVALTPWLPLAALIVATPWWFLRRWIRRRREVRTLTATGD